MLSPGGTGLGRGTGAQQASPGSILGGFQALIEHSPEQPGLSSKLEKQFGLSDFLSFFLGMVGC